MLSAHAEPLPWWLRDRFRWGSTIAATTKNWLDTSGATEGSSAVAANPPLVAAFTTLLRQFSSMVAASPICRNQQAANAATGA